MHRSFLKPLCHAFLCVLCVSASVTPQALACIGIEKMAAIVIRDEAKRVPRPEFVALAEDRGHLHVAELAENLSMRSRRLHDHDGGREALAALPADEVLGTGA